MAEVQKQEKKGQKHQERQLLKSAAVMSVMTVLSRVLGLFREQIRAILLGTGAGSDAFGLATSIPGLFRRLFAEGAMTAAFVPVFTEHLHKSPEERVKAFLSRFTTFLTLVVVLFTVLGILLTPWLIDTFFASQFQYVPGKVLLTKTLTQLMWPYLILVTVAAVLQGVLNAHKIFGPSAFAPVLMNLAIIVMALLLKDSFSDPSYAMVIGYLMGGLCQLFFQVPWLLKKTNIRIRLDFHFRDPEIKRILKIMLPGMFAAGIYQFNVFFSQVIAASLEEGSVSSLQYSQRLQELVLGVFVVSVTQVILPNLSDHTAKGDQKGLLQTVAYATKLIAFITLPSSLVLIVLGPAIVTALFQFGEFSPESTAKTVAALTYHSLGLFFIGQARVLSQAFFAQKDLRTPTLIAAVDAVFNVALCFLLSRYMGHAGIALAASAAALVNSVLLHYFLSKRMKEHGGLGERALLRHVAIVAVAALLMGGLLVLFRFLLPEDGLSRPLLFLWIFVALALSAVSYLKLSTWLQINAFDEILGALKRRFSRKGKA